MEMKYLLKNDALQGKEDPLSLILLFIEFHNMHFATCNCYFREYAKCDPIWRMCLYYCMTEK